MEIPPIPGRNSQGVPGPTATGRKIEEEKKTGMVEGITLKMTAKGKYYWDIQVYGDLDEGDVLRLKEIDNYLKREFPENVTNITEE